MKSIISPSTIHHKNKSVQCSVWLIRPCWRSAWSPASGTSGRCNFYSRPYGLAGTVLEDCTRAYSNPPAEFVADSGTKRLELSVIEHEDPSYLVKPADIFLSCPNIEILVKYEDDLLPHSAEGVDLARLRRFEWYYARYRDGDHQFATEDDDPSRGQDFLREVVRNAPNLRYLSLVKRFRGNPRLGPPPSSLLLPALVTLHVQSISGDVWTEIETWSFPRLKVLRVDAAFIGFTRLSGRMWPTVEVVELLQDQGSIPSPSEIPFILAICPNAIELNYYIEYVQPPPVDAFVSASVQVVRLHFATNHDLRSPTEDPEEDELWNHFSAHFDMLAGPMFPALKRVVLCGPWSFVAENERFELFKQTLVGRSCKLDSE